MELDTKSRGTCVKCLEALCVVFSILNAITCVLAFIGSLFSQFFLIYGYMWTDDTSAMTSDGDGWGLLFKYYLLVALICSIIAGSALYYAVLLCVGLQNNNKRYIKAFLNYGVTVVILSVMGTLGYTLFKWGLSINFDLEALTALLICFVYSGILLLIYETYIASNRREDTYGRLLDVSSTQVSYGCHNDSGRLEKDQKHF